MLYGIRMKIDTVIFFIFSNIKTFLMAVNRTISRFRVFYFFGSELVFVFSSTSIVFFRFDS